MKTLLLSQSDISGGAARATYRLHRALQHYGYESVLQVRFKDSGDWTVQGAANPPLKILNILRFHLGRLSGRLQCTNNPNLHSLNLLPSYRSSTINASTTQVVNLHWVGNETISIKDIGQIKKPLVWTFHDMWPFCGAEHYSDTGSIARWRSGYYKNNRLPGAHGIDIDRLIWSRKKKFWVRPMQIIAPSRWLANCVRESELLRDWPVSVIPNVLDTNCYQPLNPQFCRQALGLPAQHQIILFGAIAGSQDPRKGYDLLLQALQYLAPQVDTQQILCVIFGQDRPNQAVNLPFKSQWLGHIHDDITLALLYNAASVMVVPSIQENLPQTATEAQACGCPVVAFDCCGLPDVVEHKRTGYLAKAYDTADLAAGLMWILENRQRHEQLSIAARERAVQLWSANIIIPQYIDIYKKAIDIQH